MDAATPFEAEVAALHDEVDVLLTPTTAVPPFAAEGPIPEVIAGQSVFPAMAVPFTMVANLCWNPAVSVPAGLTAAGLPVGLQIQARRHADEVVLRLARLLEQARPWPAAPTGGGKPVRSGCRPCARRLRSCPTRWSGHRGDGRRGPSSLSRGVDGT